MAIAPFGPFPAQIDPRWLNTGHPILRSLTFLSFPGACDWELVSGRRPITRAGVYGVQDIYGPAQFVAQGSGNGLVFGKYNAVPIASTTYTIMAMCKPSAVARQTFAWGEYNNAGVNRQRRLSMNADFNGANAAGTLSLIEYDSSFLVAADKTSVIDGSWHIFTGVRNGTTTTSWELYTDGVAGHSNRGGTGSTVVGTNNVTVGGAVGADNAADYPIAFTAVWSRALDPTEIAIIAIDPRPVFLEVPKRYRWRVNSIAAAAGVTFRRTIGAQRIGTRPH